MEATRLCPYCLQPLPGAAQSCPHCGKSFAGRNPGGTLPVGTVLAGRYTVGEMLSIDGEGILYRGAENLGRFRVTIKEYLPITLTAERTAESTLRPKTGSEVLFKPPAWILRTCTAPSSASLRPMVWKPCWMWWKPITAFTPFWKSGRHPAGSVAGKPPRHHPPGRCLHHAAAGV